MDLPINDKELATIVSSLRLGGDVALYQKMNTVKQVRDSDPDGPYKKNFTRTIWDGNLMENLIRVKYYFKEHPNTTLSVFLKTQEQVESYKAKHPNYVYVEESN
jgi:hypothetical protein